ncbi:MAG: hypothetical protein GF393_11650, partial [Armatimonadia bacterium]|nr:hypothetical protein [Armatimonadia bacterium]
MRFALVAAALMVVSPVLCQPDLPFAEDFEADRAALEEKGWRLHPNATLVDDAFAGEQALRVEVTDTGQKYAEIFLPVEAGAFYRGTVKMRCEGVERHPDNRQHRGAVIFLQWAAHDRTHVSGGSFPKGLFETHDWTTREVSWTRRIPDEVGYLHVLLGIEGQGVAWFDDLLVEKIEEGWPGPQIVAPAEGATVDSQRPELQWEELNPGGLSYRVELSRSGDFTDPITATPGMLTWRPDRWLEPGTWHWRIQPTSGAEGAMPAAAAHSFVVADDAERWPVEIRPAWKWSDEARPQLPVEVIPALPDADLSATVDGDAATVTQDEQIATVRPEQDLEPGVHEVRLTLTADDRTVEREAIFSNRRPGSRVSFRDDRMMLVDGEPSFPLGAYRDPSDQLDRFDGLQEAGFKFTHSYHFEGGDPKSVDEARTYLQAADEAGLDVFMGLNRKRVKARDYAWSERFVGELMNEPALLSWYLLDEPAAQGVSVDIMERLDESVRRVDPFHPTSIVICRANAFGDYAGAMDVCWADVYPLPHRSVTAVEQRLQTAREQIGPEMPLWAVLQGHDIRYWRRYEEALAELGPVVIPTPTQTRNMAWLSLAAGADGIVWYWGPSYHYKMREDAPTVWQG